LLCASVCKASLPDIFSSEMLSAISKIESNCGDKRYLVGDDGKSIGKFQTKISTARYLGFSVNKKDLLNEFISESVARSYLLYLTRLYGDNAAKILYAYNSGPGSAERYKGSFNNSIYVKKIKKALLNNCKTI